MLTWFQNLIDPYPEAPPKAPPNTLAAFVWAGTHGVRRYLLCMTSLTALIGAFEALLFAMLGNIVDWLAQVAPDQLWADERTRLLSTEDERTMRLASSKMMRACSFLVAAA